MRPIYATLVLAILWAGCHAPPGAPGTTGRSMGFTTPARVSISPGATPVLSTNEVLKIAEDTAREHRFDLGSYACDSLMFQERFKKQGEPNRWVVHFVRKQPTPDSDFFILVDDATRKASLWHP